MKSDEESATRRTACLHEALGGVENILDSVSDMVLVLDGRGNIIYVNRAWSAITGWLASSTIGRPLWQFVHPMDEENCRNAISEAITENRRLSGLECRLKTPEDTWRLASLTAEKMTLPGGDDEFFLITGDENTEIENLRDQLAASENAFQSMLIRMPVATFAFDADGRIMLWNQECESLYGLSHSNAVGRMLWQTIAKGEEVERVNDIVQRVFDGETLHGVEWHWQSYVDTGRNLTTIVYPVKGTEGEVILGVSVTLDVTHRRDFQKDLRDEKHFHHSILGETGIGVALVDAEGELIFANKALGEMVKLGGADPCKEILAGQPPPAPPSPIAAVLNGAKRAEAKLTAVDRSGSPLALTVFASPLRGLDGEIKGAVEVFVPSENRASAGEADERFKFIFNSLTEAVAVVDRDMKIVQANQPLLKLYNLRKIDVVGRPCHEVIRRRSAPCSGSGQDCPVRSIFEGGASETTKFTCEQEGFQSRVLEATASPVVGEDGVVKEALLVIRDITAGERLFERVEHAKLEWERTFDAMHELVSIQDKDFKIIRANKAFARKFGVDVKELIGKKCYEVFHNSDRPIPECPAVKALASGRTFSEKLEDTGIGSIFLTASPLVDRRGDVVGFVHVAHDLTEQRRLERQLQHAQRMESIGALAGGIAHDFNNLLGGILGYASLAKARTGEGDKLRREIETIEQCALRASELTEQLLSFGRSRPLKRRTASVKNIISQVTKILSHTIDKSIKIRQHVPNDLYDTRIDEGQIQQAILNLCINARDAMPRGGTIAVTAANVTIKDKDDLAAGDPQERGRLIATNGNVAPGDYVRVSIADTGTGIDEKILDHVFEPFFTTKEKGKGTGLGLSIVSNTARSHDGFVAVESSPGAGATFHFYIPKAKERTEHVQKAEESGPVGGDETVLVVDDEDVIRSLTREVLADAGYTVHTAQSGADAIMIFSEQPEKINMVLLDIAMPGIDGEETLARIRQIRPSLPVLITSGYAREDKARRMLEGGAVDFLQKPYTPEQLLRKVRNTLDTLAPKP